LSFLRLRSGHPGPLPTVEEAESYPYSPHEQAFIEERLASQVIGSPGTVRSQLDSLLAVTQVDELMVTTSTHDPADRLRSFTLLSELWAAVAA
ncbi:MAG: alkanal monooxygenase, partial [Frankiales bacterium]|nr:alkanal monooxygenase [Frankiales bacterium]